MVSPKTTSIADGLFRANKWFSKRPPLLPLVFFKPINGHLEDHRSRVGEHPAAASGGTGPPSENTSRPFPQAPWGVPSDRPNRAHAGRTADPYAGGGARQHLPHTGTCDTADMGEKTLPYVPRQLFYDVSKHTQSLS